MDLRALRYFIEVVRQTGFTPPAETLHVAQPTISKIERGEVEDVMSRNYPALQALHDRLQAAPVTESTAKEA